MGKIYNIFISHSWQRAGAYEKLRNTLRKKIIFKPRLIPKGDPIHINGTDRELKIAITDKICNSHIVLIMAGEYSVYSKWVKKEIFIAKNGFANEKPIIGIKPSANTRVSEVVLDNADEVVDWNTDSIVSAIKSYAL